MTSHFTHPRRFAAALLLTGATAFLSVGNQAGAAVTITESVTFNPGTNLFLYSYSVMNTGTGEDIALVTIPVDPASNIMGISAPGGFELTFDPSQGWVNFNEDSSIITEQTFAAGSTVTPFEFNSTFGPVTVTYSAFDAAGTEFTGTTRTPSSVPEPSAALLCGLVVGMPVLFSRRRRTAL